MRTVIVLALAAVVIAPNAFAETVMTDRNGQVTGFTVAGEYLPGTGHLRIPLKGWGSQPGFSEARDLKFTREGDKRHWTGRIELEPGKFYRFEQTLEENEGAVSIDLRVIADADVETEGVYYFLDMPISTFAGGTCTLLKDGEVVQTAAMPRDKAVTRHFIRGTADEMRAESAGENASIGLSLDRALPTIVQDTREWTGTVYAAFIQLAPTLKAGQETAVSMVLEASVEPDTSPVALSVDPAKVRYRIDGFGGNYCFGIESPVTQYTLANLDVAWARTEMTPLEWEPQNDNDDPADTDWAAFESRDTPDSNLRREFLLAKQIQDKGIPYVISIWNLPEWLYAEPGKGRGVSRRRVHPDKWPELLECLGSYLVYAKRQYGVEPDMFSFNEANIGIYVLFSAEEHRDAIKRIGAHFESLGLKTKMLLADATGPRGTHTYAIPASEDPEAMKYVPAIAFHSWGGASPAEYAAWGDLAEKLKLPLLVTELGVDAGAWRTQAYDSYHYAMQEVQMYQELVLHARPQGTMQWEFTNDYSIVQQGKDADGNALLKPSVRFQFVRHFCNLTPRGSNVLATKSGNPKVLLTAFMGGDDQQPIYTLHIANMGAARHAALAGLPAGLMELRAVRTSETESFEEVGTVRVEDGKLEVDLAQSSLLTLTTLREL